MVDYLLGDRDQEAKQGIFPICIVGPLYQLEVLTPQPLDQTAYYSLGVITRLAS
jgi:hypothetical protein